MNKPPIAKRNISTLEQETPKFISREFSHRGSQARARGYSRVSNEATVAWLKNDFCDTTDACIQGRQHCNPNSSNRVALSFGEPSVKSGNRES